MLYQEYTYNEERGSVIYSLYPYVTAVVRVHDRLPYHPIQAVTFHIIIIIIFHH